MIWFSVILSMVALAGDREGNGGDVVVCPSGTVELYDYHEAKSPHLGRKFRMGDAPSWEVAFERLMAKLERHNWSRAQLYRSWFAQFEEEAEFRRGGTLIDVPDTGDGFIPEGCRLAQAAVQREPDFTNPKRYTFDGALWDKASAETRAGLVLHEFILREALSYRGHINSRFSRYFNALIASEDFDKMSFREYAKVIAQTKFAVIDTDHAAIMVSDEGWESGGERHTSCASFVPFEEKHEVNEVKKRYGPEVERAHGILFTKEGKVRCGFVAPGTDPLSSVRLGSGIFQGMGQFDPSAESSRIEYYASGKLKRVAIQQDEVRKAVIDAGPVRIETERTNFRGSNFISLEFYESGTPKRVQVDGDRSLSLRVKSCPKGAIDCETVLSESFLKFREDGSILRD